MGKKKKTTRYPGLITYDRVIGRSLDMRYLLFGPSNDAVPALTEVKNNAELYDTYYSILVHTSRGFNKVEARIHASVLRKFEAIGFVSVIGSRSTFVLNLVGGQVALEDTEYKLLTECFDSVSWNANGTKQVEELDTWLLSAPKELPKLKVETNEAPLQNTATS